MSVIREFRTPGGYDKMTMFNVQLTVSKVWGEHPLVQQHVLQAWKNFCEVEDRLQTKFKNDVANELGNLFAEPSMKDLEDAHRAMEMLNEKEPASYFDNPGLEKDYMGYAMAMGNRSPEPQTVFDHQACLAASPINFLISNPAKPSKPVPDKNSNVLMLLPNVASDIVEHQNMTYRAAIDPNAANYTPPPTSRKPKHPRYAKCEELDTQIPVLMDELGRSAEFLQILNKLCSFSIRSLWAVDNDHQSPPVASDDSVMAFNTTKKMQQRLPARPVLSDVIQLCTESYQRLFQTSVVTEEYYEYYNGEQYYAACTSGTWAPSGMVQPFQQLRCGGVTRHLWYSEERTTTTTELIRTKQTETSFCQRHIRSYADMVADETVSQEGWMPWLPPEEEEMPWSTDMASFSTMQAVSNFMQTQNSSDRVEASHMAACTTEFHHLERDAGRPRKKPQIAQMLPQNSATIWDVQDLESSQMPPISGSQAATLKLAEPGSSTRATQLDGRRAGQDILRMLSKSDIPLNPEVSSFVPARCKDADLQIQVRASAADGGEQLDGQSDGDQPHIRPLMEKLVDPIPPCSLLPTGQVSPRYILLSSRLMGQPRPEAPRLVPPVPSWRPIAGQNVARPAPPTNVWPNFMPVQGSQSAVPYPNPYAPTTKEASNNMYYQPPPLFYRQADTSTVPAPAYSSPNLQSDRGVTPGVSGANMNNNNPGVHVQVATLIPMGPTTLFQPLFPRQNISHLVIGTHQDQK